MNRAEQKEKLLKAIDLAKNPGGCNYQRDNEPDCVIGQLAFLEGAKAETLVSWDKYMDSPDTKVDNIISAFKPSELYEYNALTLLAIQDIWDSGRITYDNPIETLRDKMREVVDTEYKDVK